MERLLFFIRNNNHTSSFLFVTLATLLTSTDRQLFTSFHFVSVSLGAGAAAGGAGCEEVKNELNVLKTVFCLLGSKVKRMTSEVGCSYGAVGSEREVAMESQ
jgi:hypothetical protein